MNNPDTELLFPMRAISSLSDLRGDEWQNLVKLVDDSDDLDAKKIAFSALIIKLAGCLGCSADSFRALRGCTQCSKLVIRRYKGTDSDLSKMYEDTRIEIDRILEKRNKTGSLK
jgi:hypothetical protein